MKLPTKLRLLLEGFLIPIILFYGFFYLSTFSLRSWWAIIINIIIGFTLVLISILPPQAFADPIEEPRPFSPIISLFGILIVVWTIPAIIIYWILEPETIKKGLQVSSLIIGVCFGLIHYWARYSKRKPSLADKFTYFSGVTLGPPTILEFLL